MQEKIIKSKQRTINFGEVFTSREIINSMINILDKKAISIESRFLEPACGDGNFLTEIFDIKMQIVIDKYKKNQNEFEQYSILALSSLYGIDIQEDNILECKKRLMDKFNQIYVGLFKENIKKKCLNSAYYVLGHNMINGDALSLKRIDRSNKPIVFSEWSFVNATMIKRRDYTLANLIEYRPFESDTLFSDVGDAVTIPKTVKEYPLVHFLDLNKHDKSNL